MIPINLKYFEEKEDDELSSGIELYMRLSFPNNSLYELSNVLADMNQLLTFCELIERGQLSYALRSFYNARYIGRDSRVLDLSRGFKIKEISNGSIILVLEGIGAFGSIIAELLARYFNHSDKKKEMITFDIKCYNDANVTKIIDGYRGYGFDGEKINSLMQDLKLYGYDVESRENMDSYTISDAKKVSSVINKYADRIISTVYVVPKYGK